MRDGEKEAAAVLGLLGLEDTATNREQMRVTLAAFGKFIARNAIYKDLWADSDVRDKLHHMSSKLGRAKRAIEDARTRGLGRDEVEVFTDSMLDLIIYAGFAVRLGDMEKWDNG